MLNNIHPNLALPNQYYFKAEKTLDDFRKKATINGKFSNASTLHLFFLSWVALECALVKEPSGATKN